MRAVEMASERPIASSSESLSKPTIQPIRTTLRASRQSCASACPSSRSAPIRADNVYRIFESLNNTGLEKL